MHVCKNNEVKVGETWLDTLKKDAEACVSQAIIQLLTCCAKTKLINAPRVEIQYMCIA